MDTKSNLLPGSTCCTASFMLHSEFDIDGKTQGSTGQHRSLQVSYAFSTITDIVSAGW